MRATIRCVTINISVTVIFAAREVSFTMAIRELESGGNAVVEHTNKAGATNIVKNPYLVALNDVDTQLIVHERELGLTASALKKINEQGLRVKKTSSLAEVLKDLDGD